ncbi:hypothetical protein RDV64_01535 [Acuticoccus sp. MNP-M23]|uniref:hypothetical protein n=1 Tax=Acuticoccus sp. MNP-M23 TaxID=3072793 RepID=UPI0028169595|nr:hypothetical protein [Acuticoccus sp. MNP-M23]WMS43114.1 hypothetical protein RDV64_01535 [Acuticoccus sp. MNP-M23]
MIFRLSRVGGLAEGRVALIEGIRIADDSSQRIVRGFAYGEPMTGLAKEAGVSRKSVISITLALRPRLLAPPFFRWHSPGDLFSTHRLNYEEVVTRAVYGVISLCYENKRCRSNFVQGRRQDRICRGCPITAIFEDEEALRHAVDFNDTIADFYRRLGIGGERGEDRTLIMKQRWSHTMIVGRAMTASGELEPTIPQSGEGPSHDAAKLHEVLIEELRQDPLQISLT